MATGFVSGNHWFSTSTNTTSLNWSPKNYHRSLRWRPLPQYEFRANPLMGWGLLGKCAKYNNFFIYLPSFWGTHLQVRLVRGFSCWMAQTTRTHAMMCLF